MLLLLLACTPKRTTLCGGQPCAPADTAEVRESGSDTQTQGWPEGQVATLLGKGLFFESIQEAIIQSQDGDTVLVRAGTHRERIDFHGKGIAVVSESGPWQTILDASGLQGSVVEIRAQEPATALLQGFTVTGGLGTEAHGGGIFVENADPVIQHNIVVGNRANIGGGVYLRHGSATVRNNLILENQADQGGGGVVCTNCKGRIAYNTLVGNSSPAGSVGEWFYEPQGDFVANVVVADAQDAYLIRFMEPLGYTFDCSENLVWPELDWVAQDAAPGWPDCTGTVYAEPLFVDTERFELRTQSPARDSGPQGDMDPDGTPADRGAYGGAYGDWGSTLSVDD